MATLGAKGRHTQNIERDLKRYARRQLGVGWALYPVMTIKHKKWDLATEDVPHGLLLPHEMLGCLWDANRERFHDIMGTSLLEDMPRKTPTP